MSMTPEQIAHWRANECTRKSPYTEQIARQKAAWRRQVSGINIVPYKCHWCDHWHIGRAKWVKKPETNKEPEHETNPQPPGGTLPHEPAQGT